MTATITVRFSCDPAQLEKVAADDPERMKRIVADAKSHGLLHHRFVGGEHEVLVIDEWETADEFHAFFTAQRDVPEMLASAGMTGEPTIETWRSMETHDET